jgi:aspartate racemase
LPLLLREAHFIGTNGARVSIIDPTDVLAKECVAHAMKPPQ